MSEATTNGMSRREELLAVATKLFAARGYHGTRMDDVADKAGVGKATIYRRYRSKEELVTATIATLVSKITVPDTGSTRVFYKLFRSPADTDYLCFTDGSGADRCTLVSVELETLRKAAGREHRAWYGGRPPLARAAAGGE